MRNETAMVQEWWNEQEKHPALDKAIDVLSADIYCNCYESSYTAIGMCQFQTNIARFIEKHLPEFEDLYFDDCGNIILNDKGKPASSEWIYDTRRDDDIEFHEEQARDEEPAFSRYWVECEEEPETDEKNKYHDEDNNKWYAFDEDGFLNHFNQYYEPDYYDLTFVEASEVRAIILRHCTELIR